MARIAGVNIPTNKRVEIALTYIHGIGRTKAKQIADCPCCKHRNYEFLSGKFASATTSLCGRNAVQISPAQVTRLDFAELAARLKGTGEVKFNDYLLRFRTGDFELTVFHDARSIIRGTDQITTARSIYAKYIGN